MNMNNTIIMKIIKIPKKGIIIKNTKILKDFMELRNIQEDMIRL